MLQLIHKLFTCDCKATNFKSLVVKLADATIDIGFILGDDESAYRAEIAFVVEWCEDNILVLNVNKTEEVIADFRWGEKQF